MRNSRFDFLKLTAMFGIVVIHAFYRMDVVSMVPRLSVPWTGLNLIYTCFFPMTNVFVLLSCSFLCSGTFRWGKVIKTALLTIGYSSILYLGLCLSNYEKFSCVTLVDCLLAPLTGQYWYVGAYLVLCVLSPYLNRMLHALSRPELIRLCAAAVTVVSVLPSVLVFVPAQSLFDPTNGKGLLWFLTLYCVVFCIKKYGMDWVETVRSSRLWFGFVVSVLVLLASGAVFYCASKAVGLGGDGETRLYFDSSLPAAAAAVCLYLLALKGKCGKENRALRFLSGATLGVYLLHEQPQLKGVLWETAREGLLQGNVPIPAGAFLSALAVFGICLAAESARSLLAQTALKRREGGCSDEKRRNGTH